MNKKKLKIFFTLIFSIGFGLKAEAQNLHQTFAFARELEALQEYEQALLAYNRVLFFGKGTYQEQIFHHMGTCHYALNDYEKAATYFDLAYFSEKNDSIKMELMFKKTSSLLLNKNFLYAQIELLNLPDTLSPYFDQKRNFYYGITYFGLEEFSEAEKYFINALPDMQLQEKAEIQAIFRKVTKVEKINPKKARILSSFIPGLGQLYAGDLRNGLNSFVLTSAFAMLAIQTAMQYTILDAVMSVMPWYQRYYMGGYMKAETIAQEKKNQELSKLYTQILAEIAKTR